MKKRLKNIYIFNDFFYSVIIPFVLFFPLCRLSKTGSLNQTDSIVNSAASLTVNEITPVSTVLAKFSAVDCDIGLNQQILFSITGGNRHDTFLMNQQTGALLLNKALDFEK